MKILYYLMRYTLILLIGHYIYVLGVPSIFDSRVPMIILIPFGFLAIRFGIIQPLTKRMDIYYRKFRFFFIIATLVINAIILHFIGATTMMLLLLSMVTTITLFFSQPKEEKIRDMMNRNIQKYFKNK